VSKSDVNHALLNSLGLTEVTLWVIFVWFSQQIVRVILQTCAFYQRIKTLFIVRSVAFFADVLGVRAR